MHPLVPLPSHGAAPNAGRPARLEFLALSNLLVDDSYQREISAAGEKNVQRIMRDFSWSKFSPLIVVPSGKGGKSYAIIDGQHRATAALSLGYEKVPAAIVDATAEEAAEIFAAVNGQVTAITPLALFKAARLAGVPWATAIDRACTATGVTPLVYPVAINKQKPLQTQCISALRRVVERHGEDCLRATLSCLAAARDAHTPGFLTSRLIGLYGGIFSKRPGWIRDPSRLARKFAATDISLVDPASFEHVLERFCGDGRSESDDWRVIVNKVRDLHERRFAASMIASSLKIPYADVDRAIAEITGAAP